MGLRDDIDPTASEAGNVEDGIASLVEIAQRAACGSHERFAGGRQPRAAFDAIEQLYAEFALQALDGLAE